MQLQTAQRRNAKIRLGLQGPSGSGKTMSALLIAFGLIGDWTKIGVIDTENRSSELYSQIGNYQVLHLNPPFSPERYIEAIQVCEQSGIEVIIIDSTSHEWNGQGGILEVHGNMVGNSFTNWSKLTPRHNLFINTILQSPLHIICTIRSKTEYVLSEKNGKQVPEKVGLTGIQREGLDFELTLVLEMDIKHHAVATKDRTGLFMDKPEFTPNEGTGEQILKWCESGISKEAVTDMIRTSGSMQTLREIFNKHPEFQVLLNAEFSARRKQLEPNPKSKTPVKS
ncbi:AAA family ATPase [Mucilaginibacter flavidus]|uniref:AAA family ATPase n=1 Tax=Mucilaginibacter flavidus TaxID=2949309 RepID=UPI0020925846|nr:AAA family ATPase [Mucilaginibacter flavidus]MCO5950852.1 ATP-binding protein [Mucilaginibacter flavidus]